MVKLVSSKQVNIRNTPLSLKKNFSWTFFGNIIYAITQWGILIMLARLGNPEMVGQYSLALAITAPIMMLMNLQLRGVQATDTDDYYEFSDYLGLRIITSLIALVTITVIGYFYPLEVSIIIIIIGVAKVVESISDVIFGLLQRNEVMNLIAKSKIMKGIFSLLILAFTIWLTKSLIIGVLALLLAWSLVLIFYDFKNAKYLDKIQPSFRKEKIKSLVILSLPLGIVLMMGSLASNIPRYFIEYYINAEALGYFAAMAYIIVAGDTVVSALSQSTSPRLAKYYAKGMLRSFINLILKVMGIGVIIGLLGIGTALFLGESILNIMYGPDYAEYSDLFILIMFAGLVKYTGASLGYGITAARSFKIQPLMGTIWIISGFVFALMLIPNFGLKGAAYTLILSNIVQFLTKLIVLLILVIRKK